MMVRVNGGLVTLTIILLRCLSSYSHYHCDPHHHIITPSSRTKELDMNRLNLAHNLNFAWKQRALHNLTLASMNSIILVLILMLKTWFTWVERHEEKGERQNSTRIMDDSYIYIFVLLSLPLSLSSP